MSDFFETHNRLAAMHGYAPQEPPMPKSPQELVADRIAAYVVSRRRAGDDADDLLVSFIVGCLVDWTPPPVRPRVQDSHQGP